jgi:multiple sugar transport system substrate-binding protein
MSEPTRGPTRRQFIGASVLAVGGVLLPGCTTDPTGKGGGNAKVTLQHWYHEYGEAGTKDAAIRYAQEYTKQNPDVAVEVQWIPGDYKTKWQSAVLTADGPDVYEINEVTPDMVTTQQVAVLDDIVGSAKGEFNEAALSPLQHSGKLYGVPMIIDVMLLWYRKSALEKAGVQPPQTLAELVTAAKALTVGKTKGLFVGNDGSAGIRRVIPFSTGQDFLADRKAVYATPEVAAALTTTRQLTTNGSLLLGYTTEWYDPGAFISGAASMVWGGLWALPRIKQEIGDDFDVLPWPKANPNGKPVVILGGWSQVVNGKSRNIDAAKKYVQWLWLQRNDLQQDWSLKYGFHVPPRAGAAAAAEPLKSGQAKKVVELLGQYGTRTSALWTADVAKPYDDAASDILKKDVDAAKVLADAAQRSQAALDRLPSA